MLFRSIRNRSRGNEPPLPTPLPPRREERGKMRHTATRLRRFLHPLFHSEWRRGQGRGGPVLASRNRSPGNEPPLPNPLLPRREERGKMRLPATRLRRFLHPLFHFEWRRGQGRGGPVLAIRNHSRGNEPPLPNPLLPRREERGKMRLPATRLRRFLLPLLLWRRGSGRGGRQSHLRIDSVRFDDARSTPAISRWLSEQYERYHR